LLEGTKCECHHGVGEHMGGHRIGRGDSGAGIQEQVIGVEVGGQALLKVDEGVERNAVVQTPVQVEAKQVLEVVGGGGPAGRHQLQPAVVKPGRVEIYVDEIVVKRCRRMASNRVAQPLDHAVGAGTLFGKELVGQAGSL